MLDAVVEPPAARVLFVFDLDKAGVVGGEAAVRAGADGEDHFAHPLMLHTVLGTGVIGEDEVDLTIASISGIIHDVERRNLSEITDRDLQTVICNFVRCSLRRHAEARQDAGEQGRDHDDGQHDRDHTSGQVVTLCMKCSLLSDSIVLSSSVENAKRLTFAVKKYRPTGQAGILRGFRSRNDPFQLVTALSAHAFPPSAGIFVRYYHTNRLIKPSCRTNGVRSLGAGIPCPARNDERASLLMTSSRILRRSRKTLPTAKRLTNYV